ncbi:MAG: threonylcarbamoyl-AMP synthase [Desulfitobacterium sp.]|nr:threonylcarbamoyl-AMP synthase [Desulfitobacterium sp.]
MKILQTELVTIHEEEPEKEWIQKAANLIREGQLVALPTETVYGLGANALDPEACKKIFQVKGRPQDNPLIVHISNLNMVEKLVEEWTDQSALCAEKFWPGPLTLVLNKNNLVPDVVSGGLRTVALRMPKHPVALQVIQEAGVPIAAPSANLSGKPSPTKGTHVWRDLKGKIPLILDAGPSSVGLESTVLDLTGKTPTILRPGGVTKEELEKVLGTVEIDSLRKGQAPKSPGMKYRHYAPQGKLTLLLGEQEKVIAKIQEEIELAHAKEKRIGVLCSKESAFYLQEKSPDFLFILGDKDNLEEVAGNLYEGLRLCDDQSVEIILAEGMDEGEMGLAIMNRLEKASEHRIIHL